MPITNENDKKKVIQSEKASPKKGKNKNKNNAVKNVDNPDQMKVMEPMQTNDNQEEDAVNINDNGNDDTITAESDSSKENNTQNNGSKPKRAAKKAKISVVMSFLLTIMTSINEFMILGEKLTRRIHTIYL